MAGVIEWREDVLDSWMHSNIFANTVLHLAQMKQNAMIWFVVELRCGYVRAFGELVSSCPATQGLEETSEASESLSRTELRRR